MHEHTGHGNWSGTILWLVAVAGLMTAYLVASTRARGGPRGWSGWRIAAWLAGCLTVAAALLLPEPGDPRSDMARHLLLGMLAPLGLVLAAPVTLFLRTAPATARRVAVRMLRWPVVHLLGHPAVAAVFSVGGLYRHRTSRRPSEDSSPRRRVLPVSQRKETDHGYR